MMEAEQSWRRTAAAILLLALLYYPAARFGLGFSIAESNISPVWPASGLALACLLLFGWRIWPGIWLGAFFANVFDFSASQAAPWMTVLWVSALIATGSSLEALVGFYLVNGLVGRRGEQSWRGPLFGKINVFRFTVLASAICTIGAAIGSAAICASGLALWRDYGLLWFTWWFGGVAGILIVTPFLLAWSRLKLPKRPSRLLGETGMAFALLVLICWAVFTNRFTVGEKALPLSFLSVVPLVWIAQRCGPQASSAALLVLSIGTTWNTLFHQGPFALETQNDSLLLLLGYLLTLAITTHALESDSTGRRQGEELINALNEELERRVEARTAELERSNVALQAESRERALSAEAARRNQERFLTFMDHMPGMAFIKDRFGRYVYANAQLRELVGEVSRDWVGRTDHQLWPEETAEQFMAGDRKVLEGAGPFQVVEAMPHPDGLHQWLVHRFPVFDGSHKPAMVAGLAVDITDLKRAEAALRASDHFAHATIDALSAEICVIDETGLVLSVNRAWRSFGEANSEFYHGCVEGSNYLEVCDHAFGPSAEQGAPFAAGIRAVLAGEREEFSLEYPCPSPNVQRWFVGRVTRFSRSGSLSCVIAHENITERRQAEEALRKSEERFAAFMRYLPGVAFMKDREGIYVYASERCEAFFHKKPADYVGTRIEDHEPKQCAEEMRAADRRILESGEPTQRLRDINDSNGLHHWLMVQFPILDETGRRALVGEIGLDITDRVRAKQKLEVALKKEELLKREIHHRVKNNLQVIISLLYLQSALVTDATAREVLRECQSRTRSIALLHELLCCSEDLAQIEFGAYVRQVSADLLSAYRVSAESVELKIYGEGIFLNVDTALPCGLIVTELVSNSLKHAFPDGRKGEIEIGLQMSGAGHLELCVSDNGVGLPRTFKVEHARSMGFQLIRDLARQLDGELSFDNSGGTKATVIFPVPMAESGISDH